MTASASGVSAARAALGALVDYAGLFPPAQLEMKPALREYEDARNGAYAWMLGRFVVRTSQIDELLGSLPAHTRIPAAVVLDGGNGDPAFLSRLQMQTRALSIETLEIAVPHDGLGAYEKALSANGLRGVPSFVETAASAMPALAAAGLGAKIRCGGLTAQAYPPPEAVAAFIHAACARGVPYKATAGLHHPVRHFNEAAGVTMHGFLNLLAGSALARSGAGIEAVAEAVACEDAARFRFDGKGFWFGDRCFEAAELRDVREHAFIAYGSCSFSEPVEDLRAMDALA